MAFLLLTRQKFPAALHGLPHSAPMFNFAVFFLFNFNELTYFLVGMNFAS